MEFTKGKTAGGWVHINKGETSIALVHPKYVDMFVAAPGLYKVLKDFISANVAYHGQEFLADNAYQPLTNAINKARQALAKAEGK